MVTWCPGFVHFSLRQTVNPHHLAAPYSSGLAPSDFYRMVITSKMQQKFKILLTAQLLVAVCSIKTKNKYRKENHKLSGMLLGNLV